MLRSALGEYTTEQLLDISRLLAEIAGAKDGMWEKADAIPILESIDEELARRQQQRRSA